jgi:hypothetical protein
MKPFSQRMSTPNPLLEHRFEKNRLLLQQTATSNSAVVRDFVWFSCHSHQDVSGHSIRGNLFPGRRRPNPIKRRTGKVRE